MRARFLPAPNTIYFSPWFISRAFSLRKLVKICMFSRALYQLHIGTWHCGCMCSRVLTRCMLDPACFSVHSNSCMFFRNLVTSRRGPWERGWFPRLEWLAKSPSTIFLQMLMQCRIQLYPSLHDHLSFASHFLHDSMTVCFEQSLRFFGLELTWITSGTAKEPIFCRTIAFKSFLNSSGDTTASSFKIA